jgi:hypothetical protein
MLDGDLQPKIVEPAEHRQVRTTRRASRAVTHAPHQHTPPTRTPTPQSEPIGGSRISGSSKLKGQPRS